jgi:hypothetical protein
VAKCEVLPIKGVNECKVVPVLAVFKVVPNIAPMSFM